MKPKETMGLTRHELPQLMLNCNDQLNDGGEIGKITIYFIDNNVQ